MSLRARILLLILASSLLPVFAVLWVLLENRADTLMRAQEQLKARAETIADDLEDRISGTAQLLFGLGRVPIVTGTDKAACSRFLADVLKEHPQYTGLLTILPNGQLHCDSLQTGRTLDLTDRSYFKQALRSERYVVEAAIGRLTGKGVLQVAQPMRDAAGVLQGVLLASLNMDDFGRPIAASLPYDGMNFQIWNEDGSIVMDNPGKGASVRKPGAAERAFVLSAKGNMLHTLGEGADARIWTTATLQRKPYTGLRLVLSVPRAELVEREDHHFIRALGGLLALSAVMLLVAVLLGEFALHRQTARLISAIARLDRGNFKEPIGAPYPKGELGAMMVALDRMAVSLEQQRIVIQRNTEVLERQANTDALTGLANRNLLTDRLEQALIYAHRANRVAGVLLLDLDRFKTVNDSQGHSQGDVLLQTVAQRLLSCVRDGDTVARLGGDEFVLVLSDLAQVSDLLTLAQEILSALAQPVLLGGQVVNISASLGISAYPRDGDSAEELIRHADTAMYRAKEQGGRTMAFFQPEMDETMVERLRIEAGLRRALEQGELRVFFQPILNLLTGRVASAEALVRWQDPERGMVMPSQFIPIAEETGLIIPIGNWVLQHACQQAVAWRALGLGDIPVAVNLSARQFNAPTLEADIAAALASAHCPAELLQLEITESMVIADADQALQTMHRIRSMGVRLSIDDFGTGYSSLSYLKRFPVSKLKIDRGFVNDILVDANDKAIVDTILRLAHTMGLHTVAEGVETLEQLQYLKAMGCEECQGYYLARPTASDAFVRRVQQGFDDDFAQASLVT
nr:EAL domain-containing protein [Rhodoferax sp.]